MVVKFDGTNIVLTPENEIETSTIEWIFSRADGNPLVKFHMEEFLKHRAVNKESQDKNALWEQVKAGTVIVSAASDVEIKVKL